MISVEAATLTFGRGTALEAPALRGLDLTLEAGQFVTVIGSNGAGKSTLLNAVAGQVGLDSGRILISGRDVTGLDAAQRATWVARVFQDPKAGTCADFTIAENLALAAARGRRRGLGLALDRATLTDFRERLSQLGLGLEQRLDDRVGLLSGGQRQALSLIMATFQESEVLLLDEHTAALDPRMQGFVLDLTRRLVDESGRTALMVTHSMQQALDLGQRTVMLDAGRVVLDLAGEERAAMTVPDLIERFRDAAGGALDSDRVLLG